MDYGYGRVSARDQSLDRQMIAIKDYRPDILDENIYVDKQSGKDFNREKYQLLCSILKPGDELIVKELDRLGRNKEEIKAEIAWFKNNGITLRILDIPSTLIDFQGQDWIADMVNNIIIEVLSAMAERERINILTRQREGIEAAKIYGTKTGNWFGRPKKELPEFEKFLKKQKEGEITVTLACEELGISRTQWYRLIEKVV